MKITFPRIFSFHILGFLLIAGLALQCIYFAKSNGQTADETYYNGSGYAMLRWNKYNFLAEHPPFVMQWASLPLLIMRPRFPIHDPVFIPGSNTVNPSATGSKFLYEMGNDPEKILFAERFMVILLTCALGIVLWKWSWELFGKWGALISLALYTFCPNIIAHGSLYTTDMGVTFFMFLATYFLYRYSKEYKLKYLYGCGVSCGLSCVAKISGILLIPITIFFFIMMVFRKNGGQEETITNPLQHKHWLLPSILLLFSLGLKLTRVSFVPISLYLLQSLNERFQYFKKPRLRQLFLLTLFSLWILSFFTGILLKKYSLTFRFVSTLFVLLFFTISWLHYRGKLKPKIISSINTFCLLWVIAGLVIAFDYMDHQALFRLSTLKHFIHNFNLSYSHTLKEHVSCIKGSFITCDWRYFLGILAVKIPIPSILLLFAGIFRLVRSQLSTSVKGQIIGPVLIFLLIASFLNKINIGLRHVLPIFPFLFLIAGAWSSSFQSSKKISWTLKIMTVCIIAWLAHISLSNLPHHLSYFNQVAGSLENAARLTADSNLNWGQDNRRLAKYVRQQEIPKIYILSSANNFPELTYYGVVHEAAPNLNSQFPNPGYYALDLHHFLLYKHQNHSWFKTNAPIERIGSTYFLFYVPEKS